MHDTPTDGGSGPAVEIQTVMREFAARCPFGPTFFAGHLGALVREVALRAGKVGTAQRALVLQMQEHAEQVLQELTASPPAPSAEARTHPRAEEPAQEE